jgi:hypothetical protein
MPYIGNTVQNQGFAPAIDYFSGNGVTVTFTLSRPLASVAQIICAIDNVIQNPSSAYTVSGSSITFTSAPLSGTNNIWVEYTSLITTYAAISQSPSVIGDITATGGYLASGSFGNSFIDGTIVDYVTGNGRITVGDLDSLTIYNGGTAARSSLLAVNASGAVGVGTSPSYGTVGQVLQSNGSSAAPTWSNPAVYGVDYLIVAGGGGGGSHNAGGGGAGGVLTVSTALTTGVAYAVVVGGGGAGAVNTYGVSGSNSSFNSSTAIGGGYGSSASGSPSGPGGNGGSGGGGDAGQLNGSGTSGQGNAGGTSANPSGGGGGGAGAVGGSSPGGVGSAGGNGGVGIVNAYNGTSLYWGGGGGGGGYTANAGNGGLGGGGGGGTRSGGSGGTGGGSALNSGGNGSSTVAGAGGANTGGGGGGHNDPLYSGGNGGSGIVIIRYLGPQKGTGGTVTTSGSYTIHTFLSSGTYTA